MINTVKRARRVNMKEVLKNTIYTILLMACIAGFMKLFINTWDAEIEDHGEYTKQYLEELQE